MTPVRQWVSEVVQSGSWRTFDDLHIDDVIPDVPKSAWVWESLRIAREAASIRDLTAPSFAMILGFGLWPANRPVSPTWESVKAFTDDLSDSPPSLYLFEKGSEEWRSVLADSEAVDVPSFLAESGEARYREAWQEEYREYWRSVLLIR